MKTPSLYAMWLVKEDTEIAVTVGAYCNYISLHKGNRIHLVTIEGNYPGTVTEDQDPRDPTSLVHITLDCWPHETLLCHRSLIQLFTPLDLLADI